MIASIRLNNKVESFRISNVQLCVTRRKAAIVASVLDRECTASLTISVFANECFHWNRLFPVSSVALVNQDEKCRAFRLGGGEKASAPSVDPNSAAASAAAERPRRKPASGGHSARARAAGGCRKRAGARGSAAAACVAEATGSARGCSARRECGARG